MPVEASLLKTAPEIVLSTSSTLRTSRSWYSRDGGALKVPSRIPATCSSVRVLPSMAVVACAPLTRAILRKRRATLGRKGVPAKCSHFERASPNSIHTFGPRLLMSVALKVIHGWDSR